MQDFTSSLLREKFVIHDTKTVRKDNSAVVALSNRFVIELRNKKNEITETFVIRGHNMHSVVRMAARIIYDFNNGGPLDVRQTPYDWMKTWDIVVNDYEYAYNPQRWIAVYSGGKCIFEAGERHPFLDMIEKCDSENDQDYDYAVPLAETLFQQAGKDIRIDHDANVALSMNFDKNEGRCGIILRGSNKTTTFSFATRLKEKGQTINIPQCLGGAAAFLEGVQLSFLVGMNMEKIRIGLIERFSKEEKQTKEGRQRLSRLTTEISNMEAAFDVRYRPEKPEFHFLITEAEELAQRILEPPKKVDEKSVEGEDANDERGEEL